VWPGVCRGGGFGCRGRVGSGGVEELGEDGGGVGAVGDGDGGVVEEGAVGGEVG